MTSPAAAPAAPLALCPTTRAADLTVAATLDVDAVRATVVDTRVEVRDVFAGLSADERSRMAHDAWFLGLRCMISAHRVAAESRLGDVGQQLVATFEKQLAQHQASQHAAFARTVAEYFDPATGRVPARIDELLRDEGTLARTMSKFLAADGELAKVLARSVGETSPLMQRLSPTESHGLVQQIEGRLRAALADGSSQLAVALDPAAENGAIRRFFTQLREEMRAVDDDRGKQLAVVTRALDANDPASAMSQLVRDTQAASRAFLRAINGDDPGSALGGIKAALVAVIEAQGKAQREALEALEARQRKEALEVRDALVRLENQRRADARSPRGGAQFEAALGETLSNLLAGSPTTLDPTGGRAGLRKHCKVGDFVVAFTADSAYAGSGLVVEAKHDAAYSVPQALAELEVARANRGVGVGLFVMARSHAPAGFPAFSRHGNDVLVTWDQADPASDALLWCGLTVALALAARIGRPQSAGDIDALRGVENRIAKEVERLEELRKGAERIRDTADAMLKQIGIGSKVLRKLAVDAKETLLALNVEAADAKVERAEPVTLALPATSVAPAVPAPAEPCAAE